MINMNLERIISEYNEQISEINRKIIKTLYSISILPLIISLVSAFFSFRDSDLVFFFYVFFGVFLFFIFIAIMIHNYYISEKPLYNYVFPLLIEDINYNEDVNFTYAPFPKYTKDNSPFTMFHRYVSKSTHFKLSFESNDGFKTEIYDTYLFTSSKNSTTIYLDGFYFVLSQENGPLFQMLQFGRPTIKDPKYIKINTRDDCKEFVAEGSSEFIDSKYYRLYNYLQTKSENNKVNLASYDNSFHLSITSFKQKRKVKKLHSESYEELRKRLLDLAKLSEDVYRSIN